MRRQNAVVSSRSAMPEFTAPHNAGAERAAHGNVARFALGRLKTGEMNSTESAYADHLRSRASLGEIAWFKFEGVKLRLADNTFYSPDFVVMLANGELEMHEVKGFWQEDARVKIKVAASLFPFCFIAVTRRAKKRGGGWEIENFSSSN